jgi:eukaryotic-like serine/threonine-protein kinase
MLKFITHRPLWLNIVAGVVLAIGVFSLALLSLDWITGHGKAATVPSVKGKKFEEAVNVLKKSGFKVEILDSIYSDTIKPMMVVKQVPDADEVVKSNRTVYLIISRSVPPFIEMPNLKGYSIRNAIMVLKNMDLRLGDTTFKPDFAKNAVLEQLYDGNAIAAGTKIRKGSTISFVLGDGVGDKQFAVPSVVGLRLSEAKEIMADRGVILGSIVADPNVRDTLNAWIYKQNPPRFDDEKTMLFMRTGQTMDVWLQPDQPSEDSLKKNGYVPEKKKKVTDKKPKNDEDDNDNGGYN